MLSDDQREVLAESIKLRGVKVHEDYLTEELGELLQAISKKNRNKPNSLDNVREELADVLLLVSGLVDHYEAHEYVRTKMERIDEILERDWR